VTRLLAHAITRRATGGPEAGIRGRPLEQIAAGELGLWATICDAGPCLPVRFGTWLADAEAARRSLEAEQDRYVAAVDRLADRREIAVTLLWQDAPRTEGRGHAVAPSGRAFLERRRAANAVTDERRKAGEAFAARLAADLAVDQADVRHESCPSAEVALSMSLLAGRDEADALKARATVAAGAIEGVRAVVSGPWPPYSFTEELGNGRG
jgi:hypothetical protein